MTTASVELETAVRRRIDSYRMIQDQIKRLSDAREALRAAILADLGEYDSGTVAGETVVRKSITEPTRFDTKGFRVEYAELYQKYAAPGTRVIRLTVLE